MKLNEKMKAEHDTGKFVLVDLIFTFFPLIVLIFIRLITKTSENIFIRSDWAFLSLILFGQSISKFVSILLENYNKKRNSTIHLLFVLLLLFGFFPSAVFLVLIEIKKATTGVYILQMIWLIISVLVYWILANACIIMNHKHIGKDDFENN